MNYWLGVDLIAEVMVVLMEEIIRRNWSNNRCNNFVAPILCGG